MSLDITQREREGIILLDMKGRIVAGPEIPVFWSAIEGVSKIQEPKVQWALHVPLGKLHTERLVPADAEIRRMMARILALRALAPSAVLAKSEGFLLPRGGPFVLWHTFPRALANATARAGCNSHVTPHRLRHTYAAEMLRLGVSLPALMRLLGHKDIRMSLRYTEVTQQDLQREFHLVAKMRLIRTGYLRFPFPKVRPLLISPESVKP